MSRRKQIAVEVEYALIRPVAGRYEKDQEKSRAVYAWSVEKIGQKEKGDDETVWLVSVKFVLISQCMRRPTLEKLLMVEIEAVCRISGRTCCLLCTLAVSITEGQLLLELTLTLRGVALIIKRSGHKFSRKRH